MRTLYQDIRFGIRMLARNPGFAALVMGVLAVGIAANTALFSVVNAVVLRPLPYEDCDRLVTIREEGFKLLKGFSYRPHFFYLQEHNTVFESLAGARSRRSYVTGIDKPHEADAFMVTWNLFPLLGIQPMLGRGFAREEEDPGSQPVAILSHAFWKKHYGGDPEVLGKSMSLTVSQLKADYTTTRTQESRTIVGVMPPGFTFPYARSVAFWTPVVRVENPDELVAIIRATAKLKKGVTDKQANAELAMLLNRLNPGDTGALAEGGTIYVQRLLDRLVQGHRRLPLLLLGAAGFVLLIACSNAANLFLARATVRQRETAVRVALGASRGRVVRQMLTESLLLSLGAGVLGLLLTLATVKTLIGLCPADVPRLQETRIDLTVLGFTLAISVLTGLLFGMTPAWRASDVSMGEALKEGTGRTTAGRRWRRLHSGLVVSQLGLSLVLLIGAALLVRSLIALQRVDLGFTPDKVLALQIELPRAKYPEEHQNDNFFRSLLERLGALSGVDSVGALHNGLEIEYTLGATELFKDKFCVADQGDS
ncbi:MAG: ABC transporter permease, partial [Phycisphaerales bacterium]